MPMNGGRIAILEDHALLRSSLAAILSEAGFTVVCNCAEPEEFLRGVANEHPAVAIIDLGLHGKSGECPDEGLATLRELRRRDPLVSALVFSGCTLPSIVEECFREGAAGYLEKLTSSSTDVIEAVSALLEGRQIPAAKAITPSPSRSEGPGPLARLSAREREVLEFVSSGLDNLKIAALLGIAERTVKAHVSALYRKLEAENRTQLALTGLKGGITPREE